MKRLFSGKPPLHIAIPFAVVLIAVVAALALPGLNRSSRTPNSAKPVLGAATQAGQYQLVVYSSKVGQPDATNLKKRVTVAISLTNLSSATLQISPGLQMTLLDQSGIVYSMSAKYLAYRQIIGGPLKPSAKANYNVDFDIPAAVNPYAFSFQLSGNTPASAVGL